MATNTCEVKVGRLLEIRVSAGYRSVADVDAMIEMIADRVAATPGDTIVIAADWRPIRLMSAAASDRALAMLTRWSPRIERSAILTSSASPTAVMQFFRLVRASGHPARRIFGDSLEMRAWLDEVLSPVESERLRRFLSA